jgi:hypothetical protein
MKNKEDIPKEVFQRKLKKLVNLEKEIWSKVNQHNLKAFDKYFVHSRIYACIDGFVLIRYFNKDSNSFFIFTVNANIDEFKSEIPIHSLENKQYTFPIRLGIGGSMTFGLGEDIYTLNGVDFFPFQLKVESEKNLENFTEELEELSLFLEQNFNIEEAKKRILDLVDENNRLKKRLEGLRTPVIITEGKTDWKHILRALKYFHSKNEFLDIQNDHFLKYGDQQEFTKQICGCNFIEQLSDSRLGMFLKSLIETRKLNANSNKNIIIAIFDSDIDNSNKLQNDINNNVYSFDIVPKGISIEFLYNNSEIISLFESRRLYIGTEFDVTSKRHLKENITLGGGNSSINKAGKNTIIDHDIFDENHNNIALTKSDFAIAVFNDSIEISDKSWENFRHIFEKIEIIFKSL